MMRSRTARLFGSSASHTSKQQQQRPKAISQPPSRTLTLTSPIISDVDSDPAEMAGSFGDFDFGVEKLADSLTHTEPLYHDMYIASAAATAKSSTTSLAPSSDWSAREARRMAEITEEHDDDDEHVMDDLPEMDEDIIGDYQDDDDDDESSLSDFEYQDFVPESVLATRVAIVSVGKPMLIDIILPRTPFAAASSASSYSTHTRTNSSLYSYQCDSEPRSSTSTGNSSISEYANMVPASPKPFASRRKHQRTTTSSSISSQRLDKVDEFGVDTYTFPKYVGKPMYSVDTAELAFSSVGNSSPASSISRKKSLSNYLFKH